eukprot:3932603-Rhodomonas_salina.1
MPAPPARARAPAPARAPASFSGGACQGVRKAHTFCFIGQNKNNVPTNPQARVCRSDREHEQ